MGGAVAGGVAVLIGAAAHAAAGGGVSAWVLLLIAAVGALVGAAALEFGFGRWGLVGTVALLQVAEHVLLEPATGHRGGGHVHGVAGQVADANASVFVQHLTGSAAAMVVLHISAFALVAVLVGAAAPLLHALLQATTVMRAHAVPVLGDGPRLLAATRVSAVRSNPLHHVVTRRGPPAYV